MGHVARFAVPFGLGLALVAAALVHSVQPVGAAPACTDSWKAAVNGSWTDGTKWSTGAPPIGADDVCLPGLSGSYTVSLTAGTTIHSLHIAASGVNTTTLLVAGVGCQSDTSLSIGTDVAVLASGTLDLTNLVGTCTAGQIAQVSWGGTLTNSGTVTSEAGAAGGSRYLRGNLANQAILNVLTPTNFDGSFTTLTNSGTTNLGTGATLNIASTTFTNNGSIATTGSGAVAVTNAGTFNQGANSTGTNPVSVDASNLNLNGSGAGSFV
jgi:hypothetical protein